MSVSAFPFSSEPLSTAGPVRPRWTGRRSTTWPWALPRRRWSSPERPRSCAAPWPSRFPNACSPGQRRRSPAPLGALAAQGRPLDDQRSGDGARLLAAVRRVRAVGFDRRRARHLASRLHDLARVRAVLWFTTDALARGLALRCGDTLLRARLGAVPVDPAAARGARLGVRGRAPRTAAPVRTARRPRVDAPRSWPACAR
jgi:hypothetical protein